MKKILGIVGAILLIFAMFSSCDVVNAGHVGVKVDMFGSGKGVQNVTACTGWVFYNPITTRVYEFPTYIQHKEYKKTDEGDNSFTVNTKDGSEFRVSPILNYSVNPQKAPQIFAKYRRTLPELEEGFIKTAIYDAFRLATNKYSAEELISNRAAFEVEVRRLLESQIVKEGFIVSQFTSNLEYPESFKNAINAKNNAVQKALTAENQVKTAEAEAKIKVAKAEGNAQATLTEARAEAESNRLRQSTLTPMLIQQQWIEAWKFGGSQVPTYMAGGGEKFMMNIK
jgi:regulator of protease activity HflC (stomatin/prohibitin superfamily)